MVYLIFAVISFIMARFVDKEKVGKSLIIAMVIAVLSFVFFASLNTAAHVGKYETEIETKEIVYCNGKWYEHEQDWLNSEVIAYVKYDDGLAKKECFKCVNVEFMAHKENYGVITIEKRVPVKNNLARLLLFVCRPAYIDTLTITLPYED